MKKLLRTSMLFVLLATLLATGALADGSTTQEGPKIDVNANTLTQGVNIEPNVMADKLTVTYNGAQDGKYYLLFVKKANDGKLPTVSDVGDFFYIDQKTAEGNEVSFDAYPKKLQSGDYEVWLTTNAEDEGLNKVVGNFTYLAGQTDFEVYNLAGEEGASTSAQITKDGDTITVVNDKACVVLWTENELTEEQATSADSSVAWHRAEAGAEAAEGHNFVVGEGASTVVIAFIGDVDLDGKLIADDITKLITAVSAHSFGTTGEFANLLRDLVGDVNGDSELIADDITNEITAVSRHGFQW